MGEIDSNLERAAELIRSSPAFDVLVLPELFSTGYLFRDRGHVAEHAEHAEDLQGPTLEALRGWASECGGWLAAGFAERDGDRLFNSAVLVGPRGERHTYRKIHLFDRETMLFDPGDRDFDVHEIETERGRLRVGMMICFDWVFPESVRCLALGGADLILHPSNLVLPFCQDAMRTRCLENGVFAATANRTGSDSDDDIHLDFTGKSQIVDPRGSIVERVPSEGQHVIVREIDVSRARDKRITERNDLFRDRRPEAYSNLC